MSERLKRVFLVRDCSANWFEHVPGCLEDGTGRFYAKKRGVALWLVAPRRADGAICRELYDQPEKLDLLSPECIRRDIGRGDSLGADWNLSPDSPEAKGPERVLLNVATLPRDLERFEITPMDCWWKAGKPLAAEVESIRKENSCEHV